MCPPGRVTNPPQTGIKDFLGPSNMSHSLYSPYPLSKPKGTGRLAARAIGFPCLPPAPPPRAVSCQEDGTIHLPMTRLLTIITHIPACSRMIKSHKPSKLLTPEATHQRLKWFVISLTNSKCDRATFFSGVLNR